MEKKITVTLTDAEAKMLMDVISREIKNSETQKQEKELACLYENIHNSAEHGTQRIEVPVDFGALVAEINPDDNYREIYIGLVKDGCWNQDLAIARQAYHYGDNLNVVHDNYCEVLVYGRKNEEDYTDRFKIGVYHEDNIMKIKNDFCC